ncbi:hypothetical protein WICMUC_004937 [Wickerhamomyces mucosus]|uniref:Eukaryotic translation initiation factor 3 subunit L n=1 Tax=Wickerhamomyces mucosus TaxID=1378264 RepID=A0A9P8PF36_9ASCO|nr:hypothetical protein WICMUC_004937 [Wickerhamomyces mucosus]
MSESQIPEQIVQFINSFYKAYLDNNVYELHGCYESQFNKLTDNFYSKSKWPNPINEIGPLVNNDPIFIVLYSEVYYRHIYAKLTPSLEDRIGSFNNYCNLFNLLLNNEDGPVNFELPNKWLWDIIDEFIYQFNQFQYYKSKILSNNKPSNEEELQYIQENDGIWSAFSVFNALYSLVGRSKINEQLKYQRDNNTQSSPIEISGDYGSLNLYKNLGYFSIIGLLRTHTISGDFTLALKTMEFIDLDKRAFFTRVPGCHFTTYYYVGYSFLMLHRYSDAIKIFSHILLYISRTKNINKSNRYDLISKKSDQMYALLTILIGIIPQRLDEILHSSIKEKFGHQLNKIQRGEIEEIYSTIENLFKFGSPKFISNGLITNQENDSINLHLKIFMLKLKQMIFIPTLKSYLSLYSNLELTKLAKFLNIDEIELNSILLTYKLNNKQLKWINGELLSGEYVSVYDLDIELTTSKDSKTLILVKETKNLRKFADWFIRNSIKNYAVKDVINGEKQSIQLKSKQQSIKK